MKQLFTILSMAFVMLVACDTPADKTTSIKIIAEQPMMLDFAGGKLEIAYEISNPNPDVTLTTLPAAAWIEPIIVKNGVAKFFVERNMQTSERATRITFTYGDITEELIVIQNGRPEGTVDYDYDATVFGGEYYGMGGNDNFNYYIQVGTGEINEFNDAPNAVYYYFDLYAKYRGGDHPIVPNGTYTLDTKNSMAIGTFTVEHSKAHINNEYGVADTEFKMASGTVTVTDNRFEATLHMTDGTVHHVLYEGELYVPNAVYDTPEVATTLTEDYTFDHQNATLRLFYYGDYYDCGKDYWSVHLMESMNPINGDFIMVDIITDGLNEGPQAENVIGTYTACSDLDIKESSFLAGFMEGVKYLYSWRFICVEDYIVNGNGRAPISDGTISISFEGNNFTVSFDCVDDANNKFTGKFEGVAVEIYNRKK